MTIADCLDWDELEGELNRYTLGVHVWWYRSLVRLYSCRACAGDALSRENLDGVRHASPSTRMRCSVAQQTRTRVNESMPRLAGGQVWITSCIDESFQRAIVCDRG
jgi:hypothetical protein